MSYPSLIAETVMFTGHNGDRGEAYYARPTRAEKFPGIVVVHHLPGWDEWIIEVVRKFARGARRHRQGRHHRFLLGRPARLSLRLPHRPRRCRRRLLGRQCDCGREEPT